MSQPNRSTVLRVLAIAVMVFSTIGYARDVSAAPNGGESSTQASIRTARAKAATPAMPPAVTSPVATAAPVAERARR